MLAAVLFTLGLVVATVLVHYECLRLTSDMLPRLRRVAPRGRILAVILGVLVAHGLEIGLYAIAYKLMAEGLGLGAVVGEFHGEWLDYVYFSITTFTTLGIGDVYAHGPLRLVAGVESLNGLVLIGWSASFTYITMEKVWDAHRRARAGGSSG